MIMLPLVSCELYAQEQQIGELLYLGMTKDTDSDAVVVRFVVRVLQEHATSMQQIITRLTGMRPRVWTDVSGSPTMCAMDYYYNHPLTGPIAIPQRLVQQHAQKIASQFTFVPT